MHSWRVLILPYLEEKALYDQYDFSKPWNSPDNMRLASQMPTVFSFHGSHEEGKTVTTNYLALTGEEASWLPPDSAIGRPLKEKDETPSAIVAENVGANVHWMEPRDFDLESMNLQLNTEDGISSKYQQPAILMTDGSLRQLEESLQPDQVNQILSGKSDVEGVLPLSDGRDRSERDTN